MRPYRWIYCVSDVSQKDRESVAHKTLDAASYFCCFSAGEVHVAKHDIIAQEAAVAQEVETKYAFA